MKNVLITYIEKTGVSLEEINDLLKKCASNKHSISLNILDYSLQDKSSEIKNLDWQLGMPVLTYKKYDYEEYDKLKIHLCDTIESSSPIPDCFIKIFSSVKVFPGFVDDMELDFLDDPNYGYVYGDFYIKQEGFEEELGIPFLHSTPPLKSQTIPIIAFCCKKFVSNAGHENTEGLILSNCAGKHIPKYLSTLLV
jgi:hypothetical protein